MKEEKLVDLSEGDLINDIDIKSKIGTKNLEVDDLTSKNTKDLKKGLVDFLFSKFKFIKIYKTYSKNFDSLIKIKKSYFFGKFKKSIFTIDLVRREDLNSDLDKDNFNLPIELIPKYKILYFKVKYMFLYFLDFFFKKTISFSIFLLIFFISVFGIKLFVEYEISSAYKNLFDTKDYGYDENTIKALISRSLFDFKIGKIAFFPFSIIPSDKILNTKGIISGGENLAKSYDKLIGIYDKINLKIKDKGIDKVELTTMILNLKEDIFSLENDLTRAKNDYNKVGDLRNDSLNQKFDLGKKYLNAFSYSLTTIKNNFDILLNVLGDKKEKKYLVVFQNADEIRPQGGFMGSMGILHLYKGKIVKFEKEDVYSYEWNLKKADYLRLKAPEGLNKITGVLGLRDSNYFINTKTSSETIKFFMNKAGYEIDGVIYINQKIIEDFLNHTGNISFSKLGENIKDKNFSKIMSLLVESKKFKTGTLGTPKQILFDFIEEFKDKLKRDGDYLVYAKIIFENISKREIIFWNFNEKENKFLSDLGLNGKIDYSKSFDFSYPVFTSISGNKSDRYLKRSYEKKVKINENCSIDSSLKITLFHNFTVEEELNLKDLIKKYDIKDKNILNIQGAGDNWEYIRVLLPKNAKIKEDKNYVITETQSLKIVSFYVKIKRFERKNITINYSLDNKKCVPYNYFLYKQSGIRKYDILFKDDDTIYEEQNLTGDFIFKK